MECHHIQLEGRVLKKSSELEVNKEDEQEKRTVADVDHSASTLANVNQLEEELTPNSRNRMESSGRKKVSHNLMKEKNN